MLNYVLYQQQGHNSYKETKSCRTGLANHTGSIYHHNMSLVINSLGGRHTHTPTHIPMHKQKQFQETWRVPDCA